MKYIQQIFYIIIGLIKRLHKYFILKYTGYKNELPIESLLNKELISNTTKIYLYAISLVIPIALYINYISGKKPDTSIALISLILLMIYIISYSIFISIVEKRIKYQNNIEAFFIVKEISQEKKKVSIFLLGIPTFLLVFLLISFSGFSSIVLSFLITAGLMLPIITMFFMNDIINQKINRNDLGEI